MFEWFKKKAAGKTGHVPDIFKTMIRPMALAAAVADTIADYHRAVRAGEVTSPAYKRKNSNVVEIWAHTRLEALSRLWGYGASDVGSLSDSLQQKVLLDAFFEEKPQYLFPHRPSNEPVHDTLQAVFQVYLFLDEAGSEVCDKETDHVTLKIANKTVLSDFEAQAKILRAEWTALHNAIHEPSPLPQLPATLFEILYKDVTKKTKSIALSSQFGPDYRLGFNSVVELVRSLLQQQGESATNVNHRIQQLHTMMRKILEAHDPDQVGLTDAGGAL